MYKRKAEKVLGIIGVVISLFQVIFGSFAFFLTKNQVFKDSLAENLGKQQANDMISTLSHGGGTIVILGAISVILAIIAIVKLKKDQRARLSIILFWVAGAILSVGAFPGGLLPGILFIIAAITSSLKKQQEISTLSSQV